MNSFDIDSKVIDSLRFPLTFLVIFIHAFGGGISDNPDIGVVVYDNVRIFFSHIISRVAVPTFFVFSGYLFFRKVDSFNKNVYFDKISRRCKTILLPCFIWNSILIVQILVFLLAGAILKQQPTDYLSVFRENGWLNIFWACKEWPFRISWFGWSVTSSGPILIPLWYLRDLFVVIILSGLIWTAIKKLGLFALVLCFFCNVSGLWPNIPGLAIYSIFYFTLGAYFAINKLGIVNSLNRFKIPILEICGLLTLLMIYFKSDLTVIGQIIYPFFELFGVLSIIIISGLLVRRDSKICRIPGYIKESSFFIYALHTILILPYSKYIIDIILPSENPYILTVKYLLTPCLCVSICLLIYFLLYKCFPCLLSLLTGDRIKMAKK